MLCFVKICYICPAETFAVCLKKIKIILAKSLFFPLNYEVLILPLASNWACTFDEADFTVYCGLTPFFSKTNLGSEG